MKKTIIALFAVLATAITASATDYTYSLLVNKTDGSKVEYKFAEEPVITIEGENMKVTLATDEQGVLYPFADVANLTFDKQQSGIKAVEAAEGRVTFGLSRDLLEVSGLSDRAEVSIYTVSGVLMAKTACTPDGYASLEISSLPAGVYLVSAGQHKFKFIR